MAQLQALEPERARLQAVIAHCETKMAGEAASPEPPGQPPGPQQAAGEGDSPGSGRLPDHNEDGLTRAELARRMPQDGLPLGPRQMAERFHGRTDVDRGQAENQMWLAGHLYCPATPDYYQQGSLMTAAAKPPTAASHVGKSPQEWCGRRSRRSRWRAWNGQGSTWTRLRLDVDGSRFPHHLLRPSCLISEHRLRPSAGGRGSATLPNKPPDTPLKTSGSEPGFGSEAIGPVRQQLSYVSVFAFDHHHTAAVDVSAWAEHCAPPSGK